MNPEEWRKKAKETLHKAGEIGGHKAGEEVAGKVPRIREENKERGAYPLGREKEEEKRGKTRANPSEGEKKERRKGEMTVSEAGRLAAGKVPRIREENKEMGAHPLRGEERKEKKGEMTVAEAGHLGGKKGGHKGGEAVAEKVPGIREENIERGAYPVGREKKGSTRQGIEQGGEETPESWKYRAEETLKKAGHRGGEAVAKKVPRIREENRERGAYPLKEKK